MASFSQGWRNDAKRQVYRFGNYGKTLLVKGQFALGRIKHVHGPEYVDLGKDEVVVLSLMRNGEMWINSFIQHHLDLGAKHIVLLDNGSTDDTIARATAYDRVSVWSTNLLFKRYHNALRRWLIQRFGRNCWSLYCDIDELFDYPFSDVLNLPEFLGYLNHYGYTAMAADMLEMFSDQPFSRLQSHPDDSLKEKYPFYDVSDISRRRDIYWLEENTVPSDAITCNYGGIRRQVFGGFKSLLTKHPLMFIDGGVGVYTYDGHFVTNAKLADVTGVLLHYKFVSTLLQQAEEAIRRENYVKKSLAYKRFHAVLVENPDLCLKLETTSELTSNRDLIEDGVLVVSERFWEWANAHGRKAGGGRLRYPVTHDTGG